MRNEIARRASWVCWGMILSACGGGTGAAPVDALTASEPQPIHARGVDAVSARIEGPGGVLELESGVRLEVPAGALEAATEITLSLGAASSVFDERNDQRILGPTLQIVPAQRLGEAALVSAPFPGIPEGFTAQDLALAIEVPDSEQRALEMGGVRTRWQFFPARVVGNRITGELPALTGLRLQFIAAR